MNRRNILLCLSLACALLVSAIIASGAPAATTAFTCSPTAPVKQWSGAHCNGTAGATYGHEAFGNVKTSISMSPGTEFSGEQRLRATINGINTEFVTTSLSGTGELEKNDGTTVSGSGTITFTGVKVVAPAEKGCKVFTDNSGVTGEEGVIHTNKLSLTTTSSTELKITPASGATFAVFILGGCKGSEALEGLNKTYEVTGSMIRTPNGGESITTHTGITTQNTLKLNGSIKSGINSSVTTKGANGNALALT